MNMIRHNFHTAHLKLHSQLFLERQSLQPSFHIICQYLSPIFRTPDYVAAEVENHGVCSRETFIAHGINFNKRGLSLKERKESPFIPRLKPWVFPAIFS
jgi:hypothetical protein